MEGVAVFCGCIYGGLVIGVLFDVFRLLHLPIKSRLVHGALDALFYCCAGAFASLLIVYLNGGVLRAYVFAGFIIGIFAYQRSISALIRQMMRKK